MTDGPDLMKAKVQWKTKVKSSSELIIKLSFLA